MSIFEPEAHPATKRLVERLRMHDVSIDEVEALISEGADVNPGSGDNPKLPKGETPLLVCLYYCAQPKELFPIVRCLIDHGADVNTANESGMTPLVYTVLHVNHGLKYYRPLQGMSGRPTTDEGWAKLDTLFQAQVKQVLTFLLDHGADVAWVPRMVPRPVVDKYINNMYDHFLLVQGGRWKNIVKNMHNLGVEETKYQRFNPFNNWIEQSAGINLIHIAAWRGDAECLAKLIKVACKQCTEVKLDKSAHKRYRHRCLVRAVACVDKKQMSALHFLYVHCNKPCDLVPCTRLLLQAGLGCCKGGEEGEPEASRHYYYCNDLCTDRYASKDAEQKAIDMLLEHSMSKRTAGRYMATAFTMEYHAESKQSSSGGRKRVEQTSSCDEDNILAEICDCLKLMEEYDNNIFIKCRRSHESPLVRLFRQISYVSEYEQDFQRLDIDIVPYFFELRPLIKIVEYLYDQGCPLPSYNDMNCSLRNLYLGHNKNSPGDLKEWIDLLMQCGMDPSKVAVKKFYASERSSIQAEVLETLLNRFSRDIPTFEAYFHELDDMMCHGNPVGSLSFSVQKILLNRERYEAEAVHRAFCHFLRLGRCPPEMWYVVYSYKKIPVKMTRILLCHTNERSRNEYISDMNQDDEDQGKHQRAAFGHEFSVPLSLTFQCKKSIWMAMGRRYATQCDQLQLPIKLLEYVQDIERI